jgi:hypothetical protein
MPRRARAGKLRRATSAAVTDSTWGIPTTTAAGGFTDLQFRFLYVGGCDVQCDKENALRHCMLQCMITANDSWKWAQIWGTAHEIYADNHNDATDTKVDYHNNDVGRLLGDNLPWLGGYVLGAFGLCNEAWNRGWLFYNVKTAIYRSNGRSP